MIGLAWVDGFRNILHLARWRWTDALTVCSLLVRLRTVRDSNRIADSFDESM